MKRLQIFVIGLATLLTLQAQAVIPEPLPDMTVQVSPENPGPSSVLSLTLSGIWPNSCAPQGLDVSVIEGDSVWISLLLPGWDTKGDCRDQVCLQVLTEWEQTIAIEPLPVGQYDVFVRGIACQESGMYEKVAELLVETGQGGGTLPEKFEPGGRVVLLQDNPPGGVGLKMGQAGTVICCDAEDCSGNILVSWDLWTGGKADLSACVNGTAAYFPSGSAIWVDPSLVLMGRQFNQCGTIRQGLEGCVHFEADDGNTYNLAGAGGLYQDLSTSGGIQFDDRVRVRGLLNTTAPGPGTIRICPQLDGDIYHPIISPCPETQAGCCDAEYQPGDRVVLLVDNPTGPNGRMATNLYAGIEGTVICCNAVNPQFPIYVSWDNWIYGSDQDAPCEEPILNHPAGSGWSMACVQIAPARDEPGEPAPDGITIRLGANALHLQLDGPSAGGGYTYSGCVTLEIELNFRAQLSIEITPVAGVGGNWSGTLDPDVVGPGTVETDLCIQVENLDISKLPPGQNTTIAEITLYAAPAQ